MPVVHHKILDGLGVLVDLRALLQRGDADAPARTARVATALRAVLDAGRAARLGPPLDALAAEPSMASIDAAVQAIRRELGRGRGERTGVLIVCAEPPRRAMLDSAAHNVADPTWSASTLEEAIRTMDAHSEEIALVALALEADDALAFLAERARRPLWAHAPVLVVAGEALAEARLLGAAEVLSHASLDLARFQDTLAAYLGFEDVSVASLFVDPLAALLGERELRAVLDEIADDYLLFRGGPWCLVMVRVANLGDLVEVEDGPRAVDVVSMVADAIRYTFPPDAPIGRLAGDTLAVVARDTKASACRDLLGFLHERVQRECVVRTEGDWFLPSLQTCGVEAGNASGDGVLDACRRALRQARPDEPAEPEVLEGARSGLVLLAEDDPVVTRVVTRLLERQGFRVVARQSGGDALDIANRPPVGGFGLVILDVDLPEVNGFQILAELKQNPVYLSVPVLMLTSSDEDRHVVHALERGATDYLVKPVRPDVLLARVRAALRTGRR